MQKFIKKYKYDILAIFFSIIILILAYIKNEFENIFISIMYIWILNILLIGIIQRIKK